MCYWPCAWLQAQNNIKRQQSTVLTLYVWCRQIIAFCVTCVWKYQMQCRNGAIGHLAICSSVICPSLITPHNPHSILSVLGTCYRACCQAHLFHFGIIYWCNYVINSCFISHSLNSTLKSTINTLFTISAEILVKIYYSHVILCIIYRQFTMKLYNETYSHVLGLCQVYLSPLRCQL